MIHFYHSLFFFLFSFVGVFAQLPADFYDQKLALDFEDPMGLTFDQEGTMYIWTKAGKVFVGDLDGNIQSEPMIDISEEVSNWDDHGLIGMALDPYFSINGKFYLLYTVDLHYYEKFGTPGYHPDTTITKQPTFGRLVSYNLDSKQSPKIANLDTKKILIGESIEDGIPLMSPFHGLGTVLVADDGTLILTVGNSSTGIDIGNDPEDEMITKALAMGLIAKDEDIGSYRSQYLGSYGGKVLRVDASTGDGLESNPFYNSNNPRSSESRIWAYGLRNAFKINIIPNTGSHSADDGQPGIIIGCDVGDGAWEEINLIKEGGQNFGWPISEGYYWNWAFNQQPVPNNQKAPNPLYQTGGCDQEYFSFRDLVQWPNINKMPQFTNPCSSSTLIETSVPTRVISLPAISWSHQKWNSPTRALVETTDNKGNLTGRTLEEANIPGGNFDGYASIAGVFYDHEAFPEPYRGKFFSADFSGWIKVFEFNEANEIISVSPFHDDVKNIIHLATNPIDGSLYYISTTRGIHKITYGGGIPPNPIIEASSFFGPSPLKVNFDGSKSEELFAPIVKYSWDFGDGTKSNEIKPQHEFISDNNQVTSYTVALTVTDSLGQEKSTETIISLNNTPPQVEINSIEEGDKYPIDKGPLIRLAASIEDQEHDLTELDYQWKVFFHHNEHFHPEPIFRQPSGYTILSPVGCDIEEYWYRIELQVTDPGGLKTMDSKLIYPDCEPTFTSIALGAIGTENQIDLTWEADNSSEVILYEIQRSNDFFNFEKLAAITPNQTFTEQFIDDQPQKGNNIYRIKAFNKDRAFRFSNLVTVSHPTPPDIQLYPNPASNQVTIALKQTTDPIVSIKLFNSQGQLLLDKSWNTQPNEAFETTLPLVNWITGTYHYLIKNGEQEMAGCFLVRE